MTYELSLISAFGSVFLISLALIMPAVSARKVKRSIRQLSAYDIKRDQSETELSLPLFERVIAPRIEAAKAWIAKRGPTGAMAAIRKKLAMAGSPRALDADSFMSVKIACAVLGALFALAIWPFIKVNLVAHIVLLTLVFLGCYYLPDLWLYARIEERQRKIRLMLADAIDLMRIAVEAGLGFDAALTKVVQNVPGPLSEEFLRALQEMQMGISRKEALKNLSGRTNVEELHSFIAAIIQADIFGVGITNALRVQSKEIRIRQLQRAEENATKIPVKMVFPLVFCIFPAFFVVILGPAAIRIMEAIFGRV